MIRVIKAIPWALLARLGFKGLSMLFLAIVAILVFAGKALAFVMSSQTEVVADPDENDPWGACSPDARWTRLDYVPLTPPADDE